MRRHEIAVAFFFALALATFFWIPGIGIVLAILGVLIALAAPLGRALHRQPRGRILWLGMGIALIGIVIVPTIEPIAGLLVLILGGAVTAAATLLRPAP